MGNGIGIWDFPVKKFGTGINPVPNIPGKSPNPGPNNFGGKLSREIFQLKSREIPGIISIPFYQSYDNYFLKEGIIIKYL